MVEYGIRNIIEFGKRDRIKWYHQVSFTTAEKKRRKLNIGDFCYFSDHCVGHILQIMVVTFQGKRFLFVLLQPMDPTGLSDDQLDVEILIGRDEVHICGLPAIDDRVYLVETPVDGPWNDLLDDSEANLGPTKFYYIVQERLDFM